MSKELKTLFRNLENEFNELLQKHQDLIENHFESNQNKVSELEKVVLEKDQTILELTEKVDKANFDEENYQNFSLVSNLSKQITEKELEIKKYQAQLRIASRTIKDLQEKLESSSTEELDELPEENNSGAIDTGAEGDAEETEEESQNEPEKEPQKIGEKEENLLVEDEEAEDEEVEEEEVEEEVEINFTKRKIKGKYYFVSDEDPPMIYECLDDDEPSEEAIGEKEGRKYVFYDKK